MKPAAAGEQSDVSADSDRPAHDRPAQLHVEVRRIAADAPRRETRRATILLLIGLAASVICIVLSGEGFAHFDEPAHYLFARWAWRWPSYLLHDWGRPGFTVLHFLPASHGWTACRLLSAVLTAAAAWCGFRIAQQLGLRHAWAVVPLSFTQPLFFQLSLTTLTETPLALYLSLAALLALRGRWRLSAAVVSLTFVTRHEAAVFLPIWLLCARRFRVRLLKLWPIVWAPLAVDRLSRLSGSHPIADRLVDLVPSTQFGTGSWLTFFARALHAWGPGVTILALLGVPTLAFAQWALQDGASGSDAASGRPVPIQEQARADKPPVAPASASRRSDGLRAGGLLVALCIAVYFTAHTVIRAFGLFASGGYARFLIGISPLVAVAALAGWNALLSEDSKARKRAVLGAGAAMLLLWAALERELSLPSVAESVAEYSDPLRPVAWAMRIATLAFTACVAVAIMHEGRSGRLRKDGRSPGSDSTEPTSDPSWTWDVDENAADDRRFLAFFGRRGRRPLPLSPAAKLLRWASVRTLVSACVALMILLTCAALCRPLDLNPEAHIVLDVCRRLRDEGYADRPLVTASLWVDYVLRRNRPPYGPLPRDELADAPIGAIFLWDRRFAGATDQKLPLAHFLHNRAFRLRFQSRPRPWERDPYIFVLEKTGTWPTRANPGAP